LVPFSEYFGEADLLCVLGFAFVTDEVTLGDVFPAVADIAVALAECPVLLRLYLAAAGEQLLSIRSVAVLKRDQEQTFGGDVGGLCLSEMFL
jgi:hypothetical protein